MTSAGLRYLVAIGGDMASAAMVGVVSAEQAIPVILHILEFVAKGGREARAHDLTSDKTGNTWRTEISTLLTDGHPLPPRPIAEPIGMHQLQEGKFALGVSFAFGHVDVAQAEVLLHQAKETGAAGIRTAPGRTLLMIEIERSAIGALAHAAEKQGFITRSDDP